MMGLMVLGALAVYLLVSIWVTKKAASWAKANSKKPWLWGGLAAFIMYNLVFWDLIPTLIMHKHYCNTQAGFWVYKTPEQWKAENPGVETLDDQIYLKNSKYTGKKGNSTFIFSLNENVSSVNKEFSISSWLPIYKQEKYIRDDKTKSVLVRYVDFWAGYFDEKTFNNLKWDVGYCSTHTQIVTSIGQITPKFNTDKHGAAE